jgi:hypothetical protein
MISSPSAGGGPSPDALGDAAQFPARVVAREHPHKWAAIGLPDSVAILDTPLRPSGPPSNSPCLGQINTRCPARSGSASTTPATSSSPPPSIWSPALCSRLSPVRAQTLVSDP